MNHPSAKGHSPRAWLPTRLAAEALGTYFLLFAATGAVAVDAVTHGTLGGIGMSLACGLVAFAMIEAHIIAPRAFALECLLGLFLMMTILGVTAKANERGLQAGLAIGAAVFLGVLLAGPISGGSMNPARSIAPGVVSGRTEELWIYVLAPMLGAAIAGIVSGLAKRHRDATANQP